MRNTTAIVVAGFMPSPCRAMGTPLIGNTGDTSPLKNLKNAFPQPEIYSL
jgi:hypothetical protein